MKISTPSKAGTSSKIRQLRRARAKTTTTASDAIYIYDEIGFFGVTASDVIEQLKSHDGDTINVRINSPGGDVFDGLAIFNALKQSDKRVVVHIDSLAASIASIIALAGDEIRIAENGFFMIHHPWTVAMGNAADFRHTASVLEKIGGQLLSMYASRSSLASDNIHQMMTDETWMTSEEAKEFGFVDAVESASDTKALFDLSIFSRVPAELKRDAERALRDAGLSQTEAKAAVASAPRDADPMPRRDVVQALDKLLRTLSQR